MAVEFALVPDLPLKAAGDLSTKQYYAMELSAAMTVDCGNGTSDRIIGILQNKPAAAGAPAAVRVYGVSKAIAQGGITAGNLVGPHSDGTLVAKSSDADPLVGIALSSCSTGETFSVLLWPGAQRAS